MSNTSSWKKKEFNGKTYIFEIITTDKNRANLYAKKIRKKGYFTRVIGGTTQVATGSGNSAHWKTKKAYLVYSRKKTKK